MDESDLLKYSGDIGESYVYRHLRQSMILTGYRKQLRNVIIPKPDGAGHTEIDAVLLHTKGIFVIESKNMHGAVYGTASGKKWTQKSKDKPAKVFRNPILQNKFHIAALSAFLGFQNSGNFISVIVFKDETGLRGVPKSTSKVKITKREKMTQDIRSYLLSHKDVFREGEIDEMYTKLSQC